MSEADLGVRVFLIDNLSSPMGLLTGSLALLGSSLISGSAQFDQMAASMGQFGEQMAEQEALMLAANQGFQDMGLAIKEAENEITHLQNAGPMINQAELQQAENDLDYYEEKVRITQLRIDQTKLGPISPAQQAQNDIQLAEQELQLDRYEQKVAATQAKIEGINNAAIDSQTANIAEQNMAIDAARLKQDEFALSSQNAANGMMAVDAEAQAAEKSLSALGGTLAVIGVTLGAGVDFFAFAEGLKSADKAAADLTDTMNSLSISGNLTGHMTDQLQGYLFKVANASMYSADQTAQGFNLMMEKGQGASKIMAGMGQDATNLAEALGETGVTDSANTLASTLQMFNLKATDSRKTVDMLTYAFYHGVPDIQGLNQALNATGGMANAMHVPLSEVLTMLDALGRAGLSGSQGGTAFRYMLQSMYEPTQKQANELQTLGIITANQVTPAFNKLYATLKAGDSSLPNFDGTVNGLYQIWDAAKKAGELPVSSTFLQWADSVGMLKNKFYDANGKQIDFLDSFGILVEAMKKNSPTPQAFADALAQMFNVRSGQGFADILGNVNSLSQAQKDLLTSTENAGLAAEDAAKKMDSQNNQAKALSTTFTDFLAQIGQPLQNFWKGFLATLNQVVGGFTTGTPQVHQFFTAFLITGAVLSGVALLAGLIILIGTFAGAIVAPVLLAAGAILALSAAVAGAGLLIQSHWSTLGPIFQPVATGIQNGLQGIQHWAGLASDALSKVNSPDPGHKTQGNVDPAKPIDISAQHATKSLKDFRAGVDESHTAVLGFHAPAKTMGDSFDRATGAIHSTKTATNPLVPLFQAVGSMFSWLGTLMSGELGQAFKTLQPELAPLGKAFGELLTALRPLLPYLGMFALILISVLVGALTGLIRGIGMLVLGVTAIIHGLVLGFTGLIQFFHGFFDVITGIFTLNGDKIGKGFSLMWTGIQNVVFGVVTTIKGLIIGFFGTIGGLVSGFVEGIIGFFHHLADTLVGHSIIPDMINAIVHWFLTLPGKVMQMIAGFIGNVIGGARLIASAFQAGIVQPIENFFRNLISNASSWGVNLIQGFINGITSMIGNVANVASNVVGTVKNFLGFHSPAKEGPGADADTWMPNLMTMMVHGIVTGTPTLAQAAHGAAAAIKSGITSPTIQGLQGASTGSSGVGGNITVPIYMDSSCIGELVVNRLTGQLAMNGINRTGR